MSSLQTVQSLPANPVNAAVTTAQVFNLVQNSAVPATVGVRGKNISNMRKFRVRATGNVVTAGNYTVQATLLMATAIPATPLVAGNWTVLGAGTARAVNTAYSPWEIEADDMVFESGGGTMQGTFKQQINNLLDGAAAISNRLTGLNGTNVTVGSTPPADPVIVFAVALTFSTGSASNIGTLGEFVIET